MRRVIDRAHALNELCPGSGNMQLARTAVRPIRAAPDQPSRLEFAQILARVDGGNAKRVGQTPLINAWNVTDDEKRSPL